MAGNMRIWRAPLAALASVAMLATMGMAAATANAGTVVDNPNTPFNVRFNGTKLNPGGDSFSQVPTASGVTAGESVLDVVKKSTLAAVDDDNTYIPDALTSGTDTKYAVSTNRVFMGWSFDKETLADLNAPLNVPEGGNVDLAPLWCQKSDTSTTAITFITEEGAKHTQKTYTGCNIVAGGTVSPYLVPNDVADGRVLISWKATWKSTKSTGKDNFVFGTDKVPADATEATFIAQYANGVTLHFTNDVSVANENMANASTVGLQRLTGAESDGDDNNNEYAVDVDLDMTVDSLVDSIGAKTVQTNGSYALSSFVAANSADTVSKGAPVKKGMTAEALSDTLGANGNVYLGLVFSTAAEVKFMNGDKTWKTMSVTSGDKIAEPEADSSFATKYVKDENGKNIRLAFIGWSKTKNDATVFAGWPFEVPTNGTTFYAVWVEEYTLTLKYNDDVTGDTNIFYKPSDKVSKPADPKRDGYKFDGWYVDADNDGELDDGDPKYNWPENLSKDITLIAKWIKIDSGDSGNTGDSGNSGDTDDSDDVNDPEVVEAAFDYIDPTVGTYTVGSKTYKLSDVFTADSLEAFETTYSQLKKQYDESAKAESKAKARSASTLAETTDYAEKLQEAWSKLVFKSTDGSGDEHDTVYRLNRNGKHLYTSDKNEIKANTEQGGWTNEGPIFGAVKGNDNVDLSYFAELDDTLSSSMKPLLQTVYRLHSDTLDEHLYTIDFNEYTVNPDNGWTGEGVAFYVPVYGGETTVYRLRDSSSHHLYSVDANEVKHLAANGWTDEGEAFKAY